MNVCKSKDPYLGYVLASPIVIPNRLPSAVEEYEVPRDSLMYAHHERYDGTGYPRGLRGEEIPLGARIFSVADTLEAMTSPRLHRSSVSDAAAREAIRSGSGTQFDPVIAALFVNLPEKLWSDLRREINRWKT